MVLGVWLQAYAVDDGWLEYLTRKCSKLPQVHKWALVENDSDPWSLVPGGGGTLRNWHQLGVCACREWSV